MTIDTSRYTHYKLTSCLTCGTGCGLKAHSHRNGSLVFEGDVAQPINRGVLCRKGTESKFSLLGPANRLAFPQIRYSKQAVLKKTDWNKALERIVAVFKTFIEKFGSDSVAFYVSDSLFTEEYYVISKLLKNIGSEQLYTNSRIERIESLVPDSLRIADYKQLESADCLLISPDLAETHPVFWNRVKVVKSLKPAITFISISSIETQVTAFADYHLLINPGTEDVLYQAIGRELIEKHENNATDPDLLMQNFPPYKESVFERNIEEVAQYCGTTGADIHILSELIDCSTTFISIWSEGEAFFNSADNDDRLVSLINFHLLKRDLVNELTGIFYLSQGANATGYIEATGAFQKEKSFSRNSMAFFEGLKNGRIKAGWVIESNPFVETHDHVLVEEALQKARFIVYQGSDAASAMLDYADAALPTAVVSEQEGTIISAGGNINYIPAIAPRPPEVRTGADIINAFARKMNYTGFEFSDMEAAFHELATVNNWKSSEKGLLRYKQLQSKSSVSLSFYKKSSREGRFTGQFLPTNGLWKKEKKAGKPLGDAFPFYLQIKYYGKRSYSLNDLKADNFGDSLPASILIIHPNHAQSLGLQDGELVILCSPFATLRTTAVFSDRSKESVCQLLINVPEISRDYLVQCQQFIEGFQQIGRKNLLGTLRVNVQKYGKQKERIVIIGAGAGAYGFVKAYRKLNQEDEIIIFSKEKMAFYDRYKLPEYLSGAQLWDQLLKMNTEEESRLNITLHRGLSIHKIDRAKKTLTDAKGKETYYDRLIIATGSRAAIPKNTPKQLGIFTMRSRNDAENFRSNVPPNAEVVIAGGGFLGLEVAASLREKGAKVTIVQRTSRFLDRQLDAMASQFLHEEMSDMGCEIYYNDEIELYFGQTTLTGVGLKSGRKINCQALVIAIGNLPNIHLAKDCGLEYKRGVVVNNHLQTKDPSVFAVGEIAEIDGTVFNFPAAAEEQAKIVAEFIHGNINSFYKGSLLKNKIRLQGFHVCSVGLTECPNDEEYEEVVWIDKRKRFYKKCIIHQDKLVGAILIGENTEFDYFSDLIESQKPLGERRFQLFGTVTHFNNIVQDSYQKKKKQHLLQSKQKIRSNFPTPAVSAENRFAVNLQEGKDDEVYN